MSFTTLIVEHLIVGIQTGCWITLLVLGFSGLRLTDLAEISKTQTGALLFVTVAIFYPAGIVVDEIADRLSRGQVEKIKGKVFEKRGLNSVPPVFELLLRSKDPFAKQYFEYLRARIRLSRSTALNSFLTTVAVAIIFLFAQSKPLPLVAVIVIGVAATVSAVYAWIKVSETFARKNADLNVVVNRETSAAGPPKHQAVTP